MIVQAPDAAGLCLHGTSVVIQSWGANVCQKIHSCTWGHTQRMLEQVVAAPAALKCELMPCTSLATVCSLLHCCLQHKGADCP